VEAAAVKLADALQTVTRLFLDTAPVIYYVERNPPYVPLVDEIFDRIDDGTLPAVTSPVTLAECLVVSYRLGQTTVQQDFIDLIVSGSGITFIPLDDAAARHAAELRASYNLSLTDAFQIAAALAAGCDAFLTNDAALKRVTELSVLVLDDLEL
jgi:predicted nucleic acid-binding protein